MDRSYRRRLACLEANGLSMLRASPGPGGGRRDRPISRSRVEETAHSAVSVFRIREPALDEQARLTPATSALDVARLMGGTEPILVRADDSLHRLAELTTANLACRVMSVVD